MPLPPRAFQYCPWKFENKPTATSQQQSMSITQTRKSTKLVTESESRRHQRKTIGIHVSQGHISIISIYDSHHYSAVCASFSDIIHLSRTWNHILCQRWSRYTLLWCIGKVLADQHVGGAKSKFLFWFRGHDWTVCIVHRTAIFPTSANPSICR